MSKIATEHIRVLKTLHDSGNISRQAMKSIRGQVINMRSHDERERYLQKLIKRSGEKRYG